MVTREKVRNAVFECLNNLKEEAGLPLELDEQTIIIGEDSLFDSMAFLDLVGMLEDWIDEEFDLFIGLTDDEEDFEPDGPFGNVNNLVDHLVNLVSKEIAGKI